MKYIYIIAISIALLFSMQIPVWANLDIYGNKFEDIETPSITTLKKIDSDGEGHIFRIGGGSNDTMDPNDPNWEDPNNGDGTGVSVLTPINNGLYIIISLLFAYLLILAIRKRKTANR